jgi:hypothetical protein
MKIILKKLFILLLLVFSSTYSVEFSQDTVEQIYGTEINPELFITNNFDTDIIIDSMKIILISGSIFNEIYFILTVLDSNYSLTSEFIIIHSLIVKENDTTFKLANINLSNKSLITLPIPAKKNIKIDCLETGTNLGDQPVTNFLQSLKKKNETQEFDYYIKLILYQNGNISDYVVVKGFILINSKIMTGKTSIKQPVIYKPAGNYNLLGRSINKGSLSMSNNINISKNNENRFNLFIIPSK